MIRLTILSVDPDMPPEMISKQTKDANETCVLHLAWSSPRNIEIRHITHYMVHFDGKNVINKTNDNATWSLFAYLVCMCGSHNVSITAVNRCDRPGRSTPNVAVNPKPLSNEVCDVGPTNATDMLGVAHCDPNECKLFWSSEYSNTIVIVSHCYAGSSVGLIVAIVVLAIFMFIFVLTTVVFGLLWWVETKDSKRYYLLMCSLLHSDLFRLHVLCLSFKPVNFVCFGHTWGPRHYQI